MAVVSLSCPFFFLFETVLLDRIVIIVLSVCILKKTTKIEFLCSHFYIEDKRRKATFWHIMLYYFKKGEKATEMQKKICAICGEGAVTDRTCQKSFAKVWAGGFSLDNAPRSGRPVEVDSDQIEKLTENNHRYTPQELVDILKIPKSNTENHLHQLGYVNRFDVWAHSA